MEETQKIIICKGLPASGKSTWAKEQVKKRGFKRINRDDLRAMIDNHEWSRPNEKLIIKARNELLRIFLAAGHTVIIDDTNLKPDVAEEFRKLVTDEKIEIVVEDFTHVSLEECIARDQRRPNYVGEKVIRKFHRQFLAKSAAETQKPIVAKNPKLPNCIIIDIDGTLAIRGDRGVYDFDKADEDILCHQVRYFLDLVDEQNKNNRNYPNLKMEMIILSGREDKFRDVSTKWLNKNEIPFDHFWMRKEGDKRPDFEVKKEIYDAMVKDKYNVFCVFDDRMQVIDMWKDEELYVFGADGTHNY